LEETVSDPTTAYLPCPLCDAPAIPASGKHFVCLGREDPTWTEDDEADCPGCGEHLRANITGDGEREWIEAIPTNENLEDG
jgi:hypothetical protein